MADRKGTPIWFELNTSDQAKARDFYQALAGWTIERSPVAEHGGYLIARAASGAGVAGLMTPPPGAPAMGGWSIYFASDDVDADVEKVKTLGGQLHFGPMDIPHVGRFAIASDPQGIVFHLMRGASPEGSTAFRQMPDAFGHGVWIELATPDPDAALAFYGQLFGWSRQGGMPMGDMGDYAFVGHGEKDCPGAIMSSATTGAPASWSWYVSVPDIDAAVATAKDKGGALLQGPDQIPGGDYSANLGDAEGFAIGIVGPRKGEG